MNRIRSIVIALAALLLAAPAHAQVSFRAAAQSVGTAGGIAFRASAQAGAASGVLTLTINVPAGTVQNDVMVAAIGVRPNTATVTAPSGWTLVRRINSTAGNSNSLLVYTRVAGAGEPANYAWGFSSSTGSTGGILSFSGVDTASPVDVENGQPTPNGLTHTAPSVNTTVANTMLVTGHTYSSAGTWTPPGGMTERVDVQGGGLQSTEINHVLQAATGATGTKSATASTDADGGNAHILALRPAGPGLTINRPAGTIQDDVMVASVAVRPSTVTITAPSGWTLERRTNNGAGTTNSLATYWKVAGAAEPASYTWGLSSNTGAVGGIQSFSGVDTASVVDVENGQTTASSTSHATPSVTTTVANAMLVTSHGYSSSGTWTPPAGMTEGFEVASLAPDNGAGISMSGNYALQAAAGASGTKTATATAAADTGNAHILALRPAVTVIGLVSATLVCGTPNQVEVLFSAPVTAATAQNIANYALDGGLAISSAVLGTDARIVTLTTTPDLQSQLYTLTVNNVAGVAGGTVAPGSQTTFFAEGGYLSGLLGSYFANMTLAGSPAGQRIDGPLDFDWGAGTPGVPGVGADNFSVRWVGFVTPSVSGSYTFRTRSDDGVRLYIDGVLVIDNWTDHGPTNDDSAPIALNAGQRYTVTMEYYENGGGAVAQLSWSGPATGGFQFIPRSNLSHFCGLPRPVAFYKMDEAGWAGAGDVADSSGNGLNGTAVGGAIAVPARVCNGAQLDGVARYLEVADDNLLDMAGSFTVTAWINANALGAALKTIVSKDENFEFHLDNAGQINWWWQDSGGTAQTFTTTGAAIVPGNWVHVAVVYAPGSQVIYIDGVSRGTATFAGGLLNNADPLQIGADQYPGQPARVFDGLIDEVRVYGQALTQADIALIIADTRPCAVTLSHYEVAYPNGATGVTCEPSDVLITAHDASHSAVVPPASTSLSFSTSTGTGTWQAGTVAGSGTWTPSGANNGLATYIWPGGETSVRVRLRQTTAATININLVDSGARVESVTEDPSIAFVDTGFLFAAAPGGAAATIANQVAGTSSGTYYLRAVRTSTTTQACEAALQGPNTVNFGYECNNPTTCAASNLMSVDGGTPTTIARNDNGSVSAYASVPMTFDANGNAPFTFNFLDVGQATLHAAKDVSGASLAGASSAFVARPAGFSVTGIQTTVGGVPNPGAADAAGAAFIKAGEDITLTVNALNSLGNLTPNYGRETAPEGARLEQALVAGLGLTANPALGNGTVAGGAFTAGAATVSNVTWGEVGIIRLTPRVADGNYLGAGDVVGTQTGNVGRFTPFDFNASANSPSFTTGCAAGSFTYVGQPFVYGTAPVLTVTARNKAGVTTQNYKGTAPAASAFFKLTNATLTPNSQAARYSAASGTLDTAALPGVGSDPAIADNGNGTATLTFSSTGGIAFDRTVPVAPFDADVALSINVIDADNVAFAGNPAAFGAASAGSGIGFSAGKVQRFGRLLLQNAYGPVTLAVRVPMQIQYWSGAGFTRNTDDACTTLNREHIALSGYTLGLAACETAVVEASVAFSGGQATLTLAAAGAGNTGSVLLTPVLGALGAEMYCPAQGGAQAAASSAGRAYLQGKWTGAAWDENPAARAAFGLYGSQPKNFIFFRENY